MENNKWVRHRGGKCPVDAGVLVDYRMRDGLTRAKGSAAKILCWGHEGVKGDIMAYRIHKPAEQLDPAAHKHHHSADQETTGPDLHGMLRKMDGPDVIQWRDRIRELDTQRAEVEATYQRQISEITQERESLVQKLAGEGLALVEVVVQPVKDMLDCKNWKLGDKVACLSDFYDQFTSGALYQLRADVENGHVKIVMDDLGNENGWVAHSFKWHSRPAT